MVADTWNKDKGKTLSEFPAFYEFGLRVGSHLYHGEAEKPPPENTLSYWLEEPQDRV